MLPAFTIPTTTSVSASEQRLHELLPTLKSDDQLTLLRFAEFLAASQDRTPSSLSLGKCFPAPEAQQRPPKESVIMAIKRLTATYPMINKDRLLHQTSELMGGHVMQGRLEVDVINELEQLFAEHYHQLKNEFEQNC